MIDTALPVQTQKLVAKLHPTFNRTSHQKPTVPIEGACMHATAVCNKKIYTIPKHCSTDDLRDDADYRAASLFTLAQPKDSAHEQAAHCILLRGVWGCSFAKVGMIGSHYLDPRRQVFKLSNVAVDAPAWTNYGMSLSDPV